MKENVIWDSYVLRRGEEKCIKDLGGKPERKIPSGKFWRRWEDNIKMDLG
jgi:hypothetical protein